MSLAYIVRCTFADPSREEAWNSWYSGPKLRQMLDKPFFLSGQRFRRVAGTGRDYVAFWTLASEEAFTTPEYTGDWGFFEWKPYITDWSRDLFAATAGEVGAPLVGPAQVLRIVSFEGLADSEAEAAWTEVDGQRPGLTWLRSVGLDRHTPLLGYRVEDASDIAEALPARLGAIEVTYAPISELARTRTPQAVPAQASAR